MIKKDNLKFHHNFKYPVDQKLLDLINKMEIRDSPVKEVKKDDEENSKDKVFREKRWTSKEHDVWAFMFKQGRNFKEISEALKTKSEYQCQLRAYRIYKNYKMYMSSERYKVDSDLVGLSKLYYRSNLEKGINIGDQLTP